MRFSKIGMSLTALVFVIPAAAQAKPKWKTVHSTAALTVALDTGSIARSPFGSYSVWTRWDYTTPRILENKQSYTRLVEKAQLKCSPVVMKRVNTALYDKAGNVVKAPEELAASEVMVMSWDSPKRGSDGEKVWAAVCRAIKTKKNAI